jgi:PPOX class probable F420-dependent enzyme
MSPDQNAKMSQILSTARNAVVGVNRPGKAPQLSIVWFVWDGEAFSFSTTNDRAKFFNIQRDPAISLLVDDGAHGYVAAYGCAEIVTENLRAAARPIVNKYMSDDVEGGLEMVTAPNRVLVVLRPDRLLVR